MSEASKPKLKLVSWQPKVVVVNKGDREVASSESDEDEVDLLKI